MEKYDVIVVGGGPAGLSAALMLGRSRRRVLLAHDGPPRNAPAEASHNLFTRDHTPPSDLLRYGREQLIPYRVTVRDERVVDAEIIEHGFRIEMAGGEHLETRKLLLATGVRDVLPDIPGFKSFWGRGIYHCPYCHGWEVADQPLSVMGRGETAIELARLIRGWSHDLIVFTDGTGTLSTDQSDLLHRNGVRIFEEKMVEVTGTDHGLTAIILASGTAVQRVGLFVRPDQEQRSDLPIRLKCPFTPEGRVQANEIGQTPVPGLYVAGDMAPGPQQVVTAAASGTMAGGSINKELLAEEFR